MIQEGGMDNICLLNFIKKELIYALQKKANLVVEVVGDHDFIQGDMSKSHH